MLEMLMIDPPRFSPPAPSRWPASTWRPSSPTWRTRRPRSSTTSRQSTAGPSAIAIAQARIRVDRHDNTERGTASAHRIEIRMFQIDVDDLVAAGSLAPSRCAGERLDNGTARAGAGTNRRPLDLERVEFGGADELQPVLGAGGVTRTPALHRSTADARRHRDALRRSHVPEYRSPRLARARRSRRCQSVQWCPMYEAARPVRKSGAAISGGSSPASASIVAATEAESACSV